MGRTLNNHKTPWNLVWRLKEHLFAGLDGDLFLLRVAGRATVAAVIYAGLASGVQAAPEEEIVPAGAVYLQVSDTRTSQHQAIDRLRRESPLKSYLLPEPTMADTISGDISRERTEQTVRLTYGISDFLNFGLRIPYVQLSQDSTLSAESGDVAGTTAVERLKDDQISDLGDIRFSLLLRPLYGDRNALVWGFGLILPGTQHTPYTNATTLETHGTVKRLAILLQYTRFPAVTRSRFDMAFEGISPVEGRTENVEGKKVSVKPGTSLRSRLGWLQELGAFTLGFESEYTLQSRGMLDNELLKDNSVRWVYRWQAGYGNLASLETGRPIFPFRILLTREEVVRGFNTPSDAVTSIALETYF